MSGSAMTTDPGIQKKRKRERYNHSSMRNSNWHSDSAVGDGQSKYGKKARFSDHGKGWSKGIPKLKQSFKRNFNSGAKGKDRKGNTNRQTTGPAKLSSKPKKFGRMGKSVKTK